MTVAERSTFPPRLTLAWSERTNALPARFELYLKYRNDDVLRHNEATSK
jgi:hypothetical protein